MTGSNKTLNVGYAFGSPLVIVDSNSVLKVSPIRVFFADATGSCVLSNSAAPTESLLDLRFGHDSVHSCIGDSTSNFLDKLTSYINRISKLGYPPSNDAINFASVTNRSSSSGDTILEIYYSRIGK